MPNEVTIRVTSDDDSRKGFESAKKGAGEVEGNLDKMANKAVQAFAVDKVLEFGGEMLGLAAQMDSWETKVNTVFEGQAGQVRQWADSNNEAFGLTDDRLAGLAASFGDLLKPMGFTSSEAAGMSKEVVGLAGALSAWSGGQVSAEETTQILADAMLGERDALKQLGISISQADVDARLAAKGQQELTGAAREQAEAVATQELIFEKSTDAQKAWAEGGNEALAAQNKMKASMAELQEVMAEELAPTLIDVATRVTDVIEPVAKLSGKLDDLGLTGEGVGDAVLGFSEKLARATSPVMDFLDAEVDDKKFTGLAVAFGELAAEQEAAGGSAETAADSESKLTDVLFGTAEATGTADDATKEYKDTLNGLFDPLFGMLDALTDTREASSKLSEAEIAVVEAIRDHGANSTEAAEAQEAFTAAQIASTEAAFDQTAAARELETAIASGSVELGAAKDMLAVWVAQGLITQETADAMAHRFDEAAFSAAALAGDYPVNIVTSGFEQTKGQLTWLRDNFDGAEFNTKVNIKVNDPGGLGIGGGNRVRAAGGISGGWTMVGENGPEMLKLPSGSHVRSNPDTQAMMDGGGGGELTIRYVPSGDPIIDAVMAGMRATIQNNYGGNAQAALGYRS